MPTRTVRRIMGTETEFGITTPGNPQVRSALASGLVVAAGAGPDSIAWDYAGERPLLDSWGFMLDRSAAEADQLTDDPTTLNRLLPNGARWYVDHAHPEYSSPEVIRPRDAVRWDRAGDALAQRAMANLAQTDTPVVLYKNNTDGKGASYGTHENYRVDRSVPFTHLLTALLPFFAARPVICGAGRVGIGTHSHRPGFQISSRADFFERQMSLETTVRRGIVNTRDEPHATPERHRRLHVIVGDANLSDVSQLLRMGTTSLLLGMVESRFLDLSLGLANPVLALHDFSHDPDLQATAELADGRRWSALDFQEYYLDAARRWLGDTVDEDTAEVLTWWERVVTGLRRDPLEVADLVEWVAKRQLLEAFRERDGLSWADPRLAAMDIQWADLRSEKGLALRLIQRGRLHRLASPDDIAAATATPPHDTRAWLRAELVRRWPEHITAANWGSVQFGAPGRPDSVYLPMGEPEGGRREDLAEILRQADSPAHFLALLGEGRP